MVYASDHQYLQRFCPDEFMKEGLEGIRKSVIEKIKIHYDLSLQPMLMILVSQHS